MSKELTEILRRNRELAARYAQKASADHLRKLLEKAKAELTRRVNAAVHLGASDSFQAVHAQAALVQIRDVLKPLTQGMHTLIVSNSRDVAGASASGAIEYIRAAEQQFRGIGAASSLRLREAMILDNTVRKTESSQLRRLATSGDPESEVTGEHRGKYGILQRYGANVVGKFEERLAQRYLARTPWDRVREEIVSDSPFLGGKEPGIATMWAERIVRTESSFAANASNVQASAEINEDLGDMVKILSASFDNRTSADSYAVHGQIRRMNEAFESWYGSYMHPPNRPNDREIVIPHRLSWPIPGELAWKSDGDVLSRWLYEGRKGSPPPRPKMTTIPLEQFGKPQPLPESQRAPRPIAAPEEAPREAVTRPRSVRGLMEHLGPKAVQAMPQVQSADEVLEAAPVPTGDRSPVAPVRRRGSARERLQAALDELNRLEVNLGRISHGLKVAEGIDPEDYAATPPYARAPDQGDIAKVLNAKFDLALSDGIKPVAIRIDKLHALSPSIPKWMVDKAIRAESYDKEIIVVVKYKGKHYIESGVSSVVAAKLEGKITTKAVVIDLAKEMKEVKKPKVAPVGPMLAPQIKFVPEYNRAYFESEGVSYSDDLGTKHAAKVFGGRGLPSVKSLEATWGDDPDSGHKVKLTSVQIKENRVVYNGDILSANGERIGSLTRTFKRDKDGKLEVHHDYYRIGVLSEMGKGGGAGMLGRSIQSYEQMGVDYITVNAAWIGRYAWATFGYDWHDPFAHEYHEGGLKMFMEKHGVPRSTAIELAKRGSEHPWLAAALDYDGMKIDVEVDTGAGHEHQKLPIGKAYFLSKGMWDGKLSLDKSSPSYKRAYERCIDRKKDKK